MRTILALVVMSSTAAAQPAPFVELEVRDDVQHLMRLGGGVGFQQVEATLVVDPQGLGDGIFTTDAAIARRFDNGATLRLIARETMVQLDNRTRFFDFALVGASMPLYRGSFEVHAGVVAGAQVVARGGDMETRWLSPDFYGNAVLADLFVEVRYGRAR